MRDRYSIWTAEAAKEEQIIDLVGSHPGPALHFAGKLQLANDEIVIQTSYIETSYRRFQCKEKSFSRTF